MGRSKKRAKRINNGPTETIVEYRGPMYPESETPRVAPSPEGSSFLAKLAKVWTGGGTPLPGSPESIAKLAKEAQELAELKRLSRGGREQG